MEALNDFAAFYAGTPAVHFLIAPMLLTLVVYVVFRKRDELSLHALQNSAATIIVVGLNVTAAFLFIDEIAMFLDRVFAVLHVPTLPAHFWQGVPFWLLCIMGLIAKDFADYWNHRIMHTTWLWPTHAAHHSDTFVNAFTSFRVHFLESLVMGISYMVILSWMQIPAAAPVVFLFAHLHNLYVHMNLPFRHGPFKLLIASPVYHRWHHADVKAAHGKNLANIMPVWDALFGTYYSDEPCREQMGALKSGLSDKNPFLIFVYPFQEWARLVRTRIVAPLRTSRKPAADIEEPRPSIL